MAGLSQPLAIALVAATAALIAVFSLSRSDARIVAAVPEWLSPIGHFVLYGVFGFACVSALAALWLPMPSARVAGIGLATGFGAAMEFAQRFRPGRCARVQDVLVDAAGAALGGALYFA